MHRKSLEKDICPVARSLEVVGDTWSVLIVRQAFAGDRRFGEFEKGLGVAKNILTVRLRKLVGLGVLEQVAASDGGTHREYVLTEKGRGLYLVLMVIRQWGEGCGGEAGYVLVDKRDRRPVKPLAFHAHDGRELGPDDMHLRPAAEARPAPAERGRGREPACSLVKGPVSRPSLVLASTAYTPLFQGLGGDPQLPRRPIPRSPVGR